MARPLRIQYPDAVYHVTCRGNEQKDIFQDDVDRNRFVQLLTQSMNIYTVKLHSYVLMSNHFHLLVETPLGNLSEFMRHFNITYIGYYNRRHKRVGHLYQGRYKAILVDRNEYLSVLSRYIHLNPVRIKSLLKTEPRERYEQMVNYPWSSLAGYIDARKKETFVHYALVLSEYGGDTDKGRKVYRKELIDGMTRGEGVHKQVIGQSVIGSDKFITWVKGTFLSEGKDREAPAHLALMRHRSKEEIADLLFRKTGKTLREIGHEKGPLRQIAMDLLHRHGGLTNPSIGGVFGVDYSTVSQERMRLRQRLERDQKIAALYHGLERDMSRLKK